MQSHILLHKLTVYRNERTKRDTYPQRAIRLIRRDHQSGGSGGGGGGGLGWRV